MAKKRPIVLSSLSDLKTVFDTKPVRGNMVYDKKGNPVFTPTEDGNFLMEQDLRAKK